MRSDKFPPCEREEIDPSLLEMESIQRAEQNWARLMPNLSASAFSLMNQFARSSQLDIPYHLVFCRECQIY